MSVSNFNYVIAIISFLIFHIVVSNDLGMDKESKELKHFFDSYNIFTSEYFQAISSLQFSDNIITSPFSTYTILAFLLYGSDGITRRELENSLNLMDPSQIKMKMKHFFSSLNSTEETNLEIANAIYVDSNFVLLEEFLTIGKRNFEVSINEVNFKNSEDSVEKINTWVNEKTKGKISHIISSDDVDEYTKLILVNALYFKSNWLISFDKQFTEEQTFHNINHFITYVPMMSKTFHLPFGYIKQFDADFVKIQYLNEQFEMIIILPREKNGLPKLEKSFEWNLMSKAAWSTKEVKISLPKFKVETNTNLEPVLKNLGMKTMFGNEANFSLITKNPLYVDQVLQKIFIEVDEQGSEAVVATVAKIRSRRMTFDAEDFLVDHPFMFVLHYKPSSIPLFIGSIRKLGEQKGKDEL